MSIVLLSDYPGVPDGEVMEQDADGNWRGTTHPEFWASDTLVTQSNDVFANSDDLDAAARAKVNYVETDSGPVIEVLVDGKPATSTVALMVLKKTATQINAKLDDAQAAVAVASDSAVLAKP